MTSRRGKQLAISRLVALLCLCLFLVVSFAAPLHQHDPGQEGTCLLCHVAEHAGVVTTANEVGKPLLPASSALAASFQPAIVLETSYWARTPRAPPAALL